MQSGWVDAMRVGILTLHRCINYGSYWQARCLVEAVRNIGHDAMLLDHQCSSVTRSEWRCAMSPTRPARTPRDWLPQYKTKIRRFLDAFEHLPRTEPFALERPQDAGYFDAIVVGSDEVWNLRHPWYGGKQLFFGDGLNTSHLSSYAASFGNHDAANGLPAGLGQHLHRFDSISVRDRNSAQIVGQELGANPQIVLDPCLLYPAAAGAADEPKQGYALVYGHSFPGWLQVAVRQWAGRAGMELVSIGYCNDWADRQELGAGPEEFARSARHASAIVMETQQSCQLLCSLT